MRVAVSHVRFRNSPGVLPGRRDRVQVGNKEEAFRIGLSRHPMP